MLTWSDIQLKLQRAVKSNNADILTQLQQDYNQGYHLFNQRLARYFARKQQFTNIIANQSIYQVPVDSVRVMEVSTFVTSTYEPPLKEIRDENRWRQITSVKNVTTNYPEYYFMLGNNAMQIYPAPSQNVTNGMRFSYQPQDYDLSISDITSTSTGQTVTVQNGSATITADAGSPFTADCATLGFQVTGQANLQFYDILSATTSTLTLVAPYVGVSGSTKAWRIGQLPIIPQEYIDAPMHYALWYYFETNGNESRAQWHKDQYDAIVAQCEEDYSSSNQSNVITEDDEIAWNIWRIPPPAGG